MLLVEDEALVAMMIQECLTEFGHSGRRSDFARHPTRWRPPRTVDFDAAILDINLGDGMVYPVADILAARGVPFVFVTGYDADSVDGRFREVPVLQKPIEREMLQRPVSLPSNVVAVTRGEALRAPKARLSGVPVARQARRAWPHPRPTSPDAVRRKDPLRSAAAPIIPDGIERHSQFLAEHELLRKPASTFPDQL